MILLIFILACWAADLRSNKWLRHEADEPVDAPPRVADKAAVLWALLS